MTDNHKGSADKVVDFIKCVNEGTRREIEELITAKLDKEVIPEEKREGFEAFTLHMASKTYADNKEYEEEIIRTRRRLKTMPRKAQMNHIYRKMLASGNVIRNKSFEQCIVARKVRSLSGVLVITVFTSAYPINEDGVAQPFSCRHDCYYCPKEPGLPRSYLSDEPGVARGKRHKWDPVDQFLARAFTYQLIGHEVDKIELLVLGGTWSEYPRIYQQTFLRDVYWAANTFSDPIPKRERLSLQEEIKINETAHVRIIGLTLETRPDAITMEELVRMRSYGCTRIQLGVQHTDDKILRKVNRGCYTADTIHATKLIKDCGLKIDYHLMPDRT